MLKFYQIVLYFTLFSVAGWIVETIFCSIKDQKFVYRGFLNGPVCPIYGFGGLIVVYLLVPFQDNAFVLFLTGMVATSALEYFTHFIMEKLFHAKWWDYSHLPFNINGRICLQFSIMFGLLSVAAVRLIYPPFQRIMDAIPLRVQPVLAWVSLFLFVTDTLVTSWGLLKLNGALAEVETQTNRLLEKVKEMEADGATFSQRLEVLLTESMSLREIGDSIVSHYDSKEKESSQQLVQATEELAHDVEEKMTPRGFSRLQIKRIFGSYPRMISTKYDKYVTRLKERLRRVDEE